MHEVKQYIIATSGEEFLVDKNLERFKYYAVPNTKYSDESIEYTKKQQIPIYGCPDNLEKGTLIEAYKCPKSELSEKIPWGLDLYARAHWLLIYKRTVKK